MTEIKTVTVKRKKKRKLTPVVKLLCIVMIGISLFFLFSFGREVMTTLRLRKNLAEVREKLQVVEDENTYLTDQKAKLQDPDLTRGKIVQNHLKMFLEQVVGRGIGWRGRFVIFDEIAQHGIFFIIRRRFE